MKIKKINIHRLPMTKARIHLGEVVRKARSEKHYFILEKDGIPLVGIMDIDEFEDYLETKAEQEDPKLQAQIKQGFDAYKQGKAKTTDQFFAALETENKK